MMASDDLFHIIADELYLARMDRDSGEGKLGAEERQEWQEHKRVKVIEDIATYRKRLGKNVVRSQTPYI